MVVGTWEAPEEVGTIQAARYPRLLVDAVGRGLAAWPDVTLESASFVAGAGWQPEPLPLAVDAPRVFEMAGDPASGEAVMIWIETAHAGNGFVPSVWAARFLPGAGWKDAALVETSDGAAFIGDVALAADGTAVAVFAQSPGASGSVDAVAHRWEGGGWVGPAVLDAVDGEHVNGVRVDVNASGNAAVTWYQDEPVAVGLARPSIYLNRYDAASDRWSGAELEETVTTHSARDPDVAIDAAGNVFVVWLQESPDYSTENLLANRYDAASRRWSGPQLLELDDAAGSRPIISQQVLADDLGNALVVWVQHDGVRENLRAARYSAAAAAWLPGELLEELDGGDANGPHLAMNRATGEAMAVWQQGDGNHVDIWANRFLP